MAQHELPSGADLRLAREALGLSRLAAAAQVNCDPSTLQQYEVNGIKPRSLLLRASIAKHYRAWTKLTSAAAEAVA